MEMPEKYLISYFVFRFIFAVMSIDPRVTFIPGSTVALSLPIIR